jgi:pyrroline-5-carboxylate reductase
MIIWGKGGNAMGKAADIGFAGAGQMGEALIQGLLEAGSYQPAGVMASDARSERLQFMRERFGIQVTSRNADLAKRCKTVVLAVKPQDMPSALSDINPHVGKEHLVISIAAGVPLRYLETQLPEGVRVVRTMPNMACLIQMGCSALAPGQHATRADMDRAKSIFKAVGAVVEAEEKWMDAVTALSGSGPAYVFLFLEALIEAGARMGLPRDISRTLAQHTLRGAAELALTSGVHPAELKDRVASPGGTTLAGLAELEKGAFRSLLLQAVQAAALRAKELGEQIK